jgi:hypothetical protein
MILKFKSGAFTLEIEKVGNVVKVLMTNSDKQMVGFVPLDKDDWNKMLRIIGVIEQ